MGIRFTKSAGGIVLNQKGAVLVVSSRGNAPIWTLPKGHIDEGEDALSAAKREIYEESGIQIKSLKYITDLGSYQRYRISRDGGEDKSESKEIFMFLFTTTEEDLHPVDPYNPEARWVKPDDVLGHLTHYKDKEFYLNFLNEIKEQKATA